MPLPSDVALRWGVVTSASPLRVRRDYPGSLPPNASPNTLVSGLQVGDKVLLAEHDRQFTVVGRAGGARVGAGWSYLAGSVGPGWVTVAKAPPNGRSSGVFSIVNGHNGAHDLLTLRASTSFGRSSISVDDYLSHSGTAPGITAARVLHDSTDPTYGPAILQVQLARSLSNWSVQCDQLTDPYLQPWEPAGLGSSVSGYNSTPYEQVGLYPSGTLLLGPMNGWTNYNSTWSNLRLDVAGGMVTLGGMVEGSGKTSDTLGTVPVGLRPERRLIFPATLFTGSEHVPGRVDVLTTGEIALNNPTFGTVSWLSLDGSTYKPYQ